MGPWLIDARTRDEFDIWLGDRSPLQRRPVVMVIRGDSPAVRELLPNALDAAKLVEGRLVVWVKDPGLLTNDEAQRFFSSDHSIVAAVLSADRRVESWVYRDRLDVDDAAFAFAKAES